MKRRVVVISGYFSPCHRGHCDYAQFARNYAGPDGLVYCIVNSDAQSILKKGFSFVPEEDRLAVMGSLKYVDRAILSIDDDRTVCETLRMLCESKDYERPTHFLNDGDVNEGNRCPEEIVCKTYGIDFVYGKSGKVQSSSWILEQSVKTAYEHLCATHP